MKQVICCFLLLVSTFLLGQTHINQILPNIGARPGPAIFVEDSSYVVLGTFLTPTEFDIARLDLSGNIIKSKTYNYTSVSEVSTCQKCLKKHNDFYYYAKTHFYRQDSTAVVFTKYDVNLDSIMNKDLIQFQGALPQIYDLEFDTDSTFIVSGWLFRELPVGFKHDLWVARFDTNFNPIWQQRVEDNYPNLFFGYRGDDLVIDAYGSVLVSGRWYGHENAVTNINYGSFAARLDIETGDLHWIKEFTGPAGSFEMAALDEGNGEYAFAQHQFLTSFPGTPHPDTTHIRFGKMDTMGVVIWDTTYARHRGQFHFRDMQKTLDGNYYIAGEGRLPYYDFSSGFKFSPSGDSLWYRYYHHQDSTDASHIWSFAPTPDTGFVHMGIYVDWDNDYDPQRVQYSWLLKTDKHGCAVEGCESIGLEEMPLTQINVEVYPNPSAGKFVIEIREEDKLKEMEAKVYDGLGRLVCQTKLKKDRNPIELKLPDGIYSLHITTNYTTIYTQKLILQ